MRFTFPSFPIGSHDERYTRNRVQLVWLLRVLFWKQYRLNTNSFFFLFFSKENDIKKEEKLLVWKLRNVLILPNNTVRYFMFIRLLNRSSKTDPCEQRNCYFFWILFFMLVWFPGGGLSSYTPSKVHIESTFELGVSRSTALDSSMEQSAPSNAAVQVESALNYIKPAEEKTTWSAETTSDLLFWKLFWGPWKSNRSPKLFPIQLSAGTAEPTKLILNWIPARLLIVLVIYKLVLRYRLECCLPLHFMRSDATSAELERYFCWVFFSLLFFFKSCIVWYADENQRFLLIF